ncbi:MAG: protein-export chaperone SecB [Alphaproteobacteria bacterium]|nr:protein-export chaperone SecB [Alphaproteobacteria bacterium]
MADTPSNTSDENDNSGAKEESAAAQASPAEAATPQITVLSQYVKDLSFENPRAPNSVSPEEEPPQVNVNVNVGAQSLDDENYEVSISIEATAEQGENTVFVVELLYAGVFSLGNVTDEQRQMLLLIECPRVLFPFARNIVAEVTRDGGFPPLLIQPIDFVALYQRQQAQAEAAGTA